MERLWYLIAVLIAILIALALGLWGFSTADDVATATGPVVTALATIGAAIFGIAIGREAGKSEGREEGMKAGRKDMAAEVKPHLEGIAGTQPKIGLARGTHRPTTDVGPDERGSLTALSARLDRILES
jgi:ABC-type proline/glycine betaine transport system permease subunit